MNRQQIARFNKLAATGVDLDALIKTARTAAPAPAPKPTGLEVGGSTLPEGTMLRTWHHGKRRPFWGEVRNGRICIRGKEYDTPSNAASDLLGRSTNGYAAFEALLPGGKHWRRLSVLRGRRMGRATH